jgi:hypothetical protein
MTNEERLIQYSAAAFALGTYVATTWISAKSQRSVLPYGLLMALHALIALSLWKQELHRGGGDAAGNALQSGLLWLSWLASSVGFGCVAWLVFFVSRLVFGGAPSVRVE